MAFVQTTATSGQRAGFGEWIRRMLEIQRVQRRRRAIYHRTVRELAGLTDRELRDLGLWRGNLRGVAWEAARTVQ